MPNLLNINIKAFSGIEGAVIAYKDDDIPEFFKSEKFTVESTNLFTEEELNDNRC